MTAHLQRRCPCLTRGRRRGAAGTAQTGGQLLRGQGRLVVQRRRLQDEGEPPGRRHPAHGVSPRPKLERTYTELRVCVWCSFCCVRACVLYIPACTRLYKRSTRADTCVQSELAMWVKQCFGLPQCMADIRESCLILQSNLVIYSFRIGSRRVLHLPLMCENGGGGGGRGGGGGPKVRRCGWPWHGRSSPAQ